jgi:hypothetical protein
MFIALFMFIMFITFAVSGLKARRVCSANNSWSAVDTSECLKTKLTEKLQKILDSSSDIESTSHELVELQHLENSKSVGMELELTIYPYICFAYKE